MNLDKLVEAYRTSRRSRNAAGLGFKLAYLALSLTLPGVTIWADTVNFAGLNLGPSTSLQIGGVTVLGLPGRVSTVQGTGLGVDAVGPLDSVDREMHYSLGQVYPDRDFTEAIYFQVQGIIDAITVLPRFTVIGSSDQVKLPFEIMVTPSLIDPFRVLDPSVSSAVTIDFPSEISPSSASIEINGSFGEAQDFFGYRSQHNPDETFQFGFSVISVDYTPVSEPSSGAILGVGAISVWLLVGPFVRRPRARA